MRLSSGDIEYEVDRSALAAALFDLVGVVVTGGDTLAEQAARRLVVNALRADGATWPQLGELLSVGDPRHLYRAPPAPKSPLWSRWQQGAPLTDEAREMGERLLVRLRNPAVPRAGALLALDTALREFIASAERVRIAIRNYEVQP